MDGLWNKFGQGAKPVMDLSDEEAVRLAIEKDRLIVMKAKREMAADKRHGGVP